MININKLLILSIIVIPISKAKAELVLSKEAKLNKVIQSQLNNLYEVTNQEAEPVNKKVARKLQIEATNLGISKGFNYRTNEIYQLLEENADLYYQAYNFSQFIIDGNLLLPAIEVHQDIIEQQADGSIRTIDTAITILKDAKVVQNPPTWRDYLIRPSLDEVIVNPRTLPKTNHESAIFNTAFAKGFKIGKETAERIYFRDAARLDRDIAGHYAFRVEQAKNVFTLPRLGVDNIPVYKTTDGKKFYVNDATIRVKEHSQFNNIDKWKPSFSTIPKTGENDEQR